MFDFRQMTVILFSIISFTLADLDVTDSVNHNLDGFISDNSFDNESDLKVSISEFQPVYVQPPSGFQPIIHAIRTMDGVHPGLAGSLTPTLPTPINPDLPYKYAHGISSWLLGGVRAIERTGWWENLGSDTALNLRSKGRPVTITEWIDLAPKRVLNDDDEKLTTLSNQIAH